MWRSGVRSKVFLKRRCSPGFQTVQELAAEDANDQRVAGSERDERDENRVSGICWGRRNDETLDRRIPSILARWTPFGSRIFPNASLVRLLGISKNEPHLVVH